MHAMIKKRTSKNLTVHPRSSSPGSHILSHATPALLPLYRYRHTEQELSSSSSEKKTQLHVLLPRLLPVVLLREKPCTVYTLQQHRTAAVCAMALKAAVQRLSALTSQQLGTQCFATKAAPAASTAAAVVAKKDWNAVQIPKKTLEGMPTITEARQAFAGDLRYATPLSRALLAVLVAGQCVSTRVQSVSPLFDSSAICFPPPSRSSSGLGLGDGISSHTAKWLSVRMHRWIHC